MENRIKSERILKNWTQADLCERVDVNASTMSKYENGAPIPSKVLTDMALLFGCSLDWLLCLSDVREVTEQQQ